MSAYERRQLKKKQMGGEGLEEREVEEVENRQKPKKTVNEPLPRRKKAKMKKIKEKYSWQDEEDKKLHMAMLGHKVQVQDNQVVVEQTKSKKATAVDKQLEENQAKRTLQKERENKRMRKEKEEEELRQLLREEKIDLLSPEDKKKLEDNKAQGLGVNLSALTGKPLPQDILLYAIPTCAPYDAIKDFKYKVKVLPSAGSKKGQAVKLAMHMFLTQPETTPREKELLKSIPDTELLNAMISNVKVSAPKAVVSTQSTGGLSRDRRKMSTFEHERNLPRLPVPELNSTLNKYIRTIEPYCKTSSELEDHRLLVENFSKTIGPELQKRLINS
eukprot:TRINITY_DN2745_c0_g2_i18.p2 TRINITY_DN2745_c0_g2~~TRINITY_DN2745_c0_g2_i18.p2  ORF type:complete len:330 (+),score=109.45 TRINITY_DN2745_c0_g2_i18:224-1213(+)